MHTLNDVEKAYSNYRQPIFSFKLLNLRKKVVSKLNLKPDDKVLDIACGTGLNFKHIEKLIGKKGKITGVDYTRGMLKSAEKLIKSNNYNNIKLIQADAARLKLNQKFDAVISTLGFSSIPAHKAALKIAVNSLKKGKKLVILDGKLFNFKPLNLLMPLLRWNKSWDKNKNLIKDIKQLFPNKKIKIEEYNLGSNFILELIN